MRISKIVKSPVANVGNWQAIDAGWNGDGPFHSVVASNGDRATIGCAVKLGLHRPRRKSQQTDREDEVDPIL